jgi:hypothetical protein
MKHRYYTYAAVLLGPVLASCFLDPEVKTTRTSAPSDTPELANLADGGVRGDASSPAAVSFARDIRPLFAGVGGMTGCRPCHYSSDPNPIGITQGGLDLTTLGKLRIGGNLTGARVLVPGKPDESILVQRLEGKTGTQMPKNRAPWSASDILKVRVWIAEGARGEDAE